ncbi:MAG: FMN-binding protein [bacterium]
MKESKLWMVLSLFITCCIVAFALSQVYAITKPKIDYQRQVAGLRNALGAVMPEANRFEPANLDSTVWRAYNGDQRIGTILLVAKQGYGGLVPVTAGIGLDGKVVAIRVASPAEGLKETPGLGLKATEEKFRHQFKGKTSSDLRLKNDGGTIEAITGATITSRAVTDALRETMERYQEIIKGNE